MSLLPKIPQILQSQSPKRLLEMREIGKSIFSSHFSSLNNILISTISAIEGRIIPGRARSKMEWNIIKQDLKFSFENISSECPIIGKEENILF